MSSRRRNPTHQIEVRQANEDRVAHYANIAVDHTRAKMRSEWEVSTGKRMEKTDLLHRMDVAQARHDELVVARRERLAQKLSEERQLFETMLRNMQETDDQRRERIMQKARELRTQREELRRQESERLRDQAFRQQSVLIREAESAIKVLHVANQRQQQLEEAAAKKQREAEEESLFAELAKEQQSKQTDRARQDLEARHLRQQQTKQFLAQQAEANLKRKLDEKQRTLEEDHRAIQAIEEGKRADAAAEEMRRKRQLQIAAETKARNIEIERIKAIERTQLAEEDKKNLEELLEKIREDEERDAARRREIKESHVNHMKFVEAQMNAAAESETALDRLWQEENDKEWSKRERQWGEEQRRRELLLKDVFNTRKAQVESIRENERKANEAKIQAHEQMVEDIHKLASQDRGDLQQKREVAKVNQQFLASQIQSKEDAKLRSREDARQELTAAQAEEAMYQQKLVNELAKLENAKPAQYSGVQLKPKRQHGLFF